MKEKCNNCENTPEAELQKFPCLSCQNTYYVEVPLARASLAEWEDEPYFEELEALQLDARRATRQAEELSKLKPGAKASYDAMLKTTLAKLETAAVKLTEGR